jgi:hypothetical protein
MIMTSLPPGDFPDGEPEDTPGPDELLPDALTPGR